MNYNKNLVENTVSAINQTQEKFKVVLEKEAKLRVLFLGNSITLHEVAPAIGWNRNWGMAASAEEKDYVHLVLAHLQKAYGNISYCVCNVGAWERNYRDENAILQFAGAEAFRADVIITRLGENVGVGNFEREAFYQRFRSFLAYFKQPKSKMLVTDLFWSYPPMNDVIERICKEEGYAFVSIADLGEDENNKAVREFAHKGVGLHPNDLGMRKIAERIIEKL